MIRLGLAALLLAAPAAAQTAPPPMPTRDVDVTYQVPAAAGALTQRTRFDIAHGRVRIDPPTPGLYILVDEPGHEMLMVVPANRSVLQMPYDASRVRGGLAGGRAQRLGPDTVAGLACTEWQTTDNADHPIIACVTDDGVLLRARTGANALVVATRVTYGPIDAALFAIPAGFRREAAPRSQP